MANLDLKSLRYYEHGKDEYVLHHKHHEYEFIYYVEGEGDTDIAGERLHFKAPCLIVVKPFVDHDEKTLISSKIYMSLFNTKDYLFSNDYVLINFNEESLKRFNELFFKLKKDYESSPILPNNLLSLWFELTLKTALEEYKVDPKKERNYRDIVEKTKNYIRLNYQTDINFNNLAKAYGYSYHRLRHIFQDFTGSSLNQYILNYRLDKARQLLKDTNLSSKEIAYSIGFHSNVSFNNFFKKRTGLSPFEFKRLLEKQIDTNVVILNKSLPNIYLDTDLGDDCDDALAIALLDIAQANGEVNIVGMSHCSGSEEGAKCVDIINRYYGNKNTKASLYKGKPYLNKKPHLFINKIIESNANINWQNKFTNAVCDMRKVLANSNNKSVILLCIGQLNNVVDLLLSEPDQYSRKNGLDLVKQKVLKVVAMCGSIYDDFAISIGVDKRHVEYNIAANKDAAKMFFKLINVPVILVDYAFGLSIKTGASLFDKKQLDNPVSIAYKVFENGPRFSWDPLATLAAIGNHKELFETIGPGNITLTKNLMTKYCDDKNGKFYYLRPKSSLKEIENTIENIIKGGI